MTLVDLVALRDLVDGHRVELARGSLITNGPAADYWTQLAAKCQARVDAYQQGRVIP